MCGIKLVFVGYVTYDIRLIACEFIFTASRAGQFFETKICQVFGTLFTAYLRYENLSLQMSSGILFNLYYFSMPKY
jgi:hypothetical protein